MVRLERKAHQMLYPLGSTDLFVPSEIEPVSDDAFLLQPPYLFVRHAQQPLELFLAKY